VNIREKLKTGRVYCDGGLGTLLQAHGLAAGELPELWNLDHADVMVGIHKEYLKAGCDIVAANTFGANSLKYGDQLPSIIAAAVQNARKAIQESGREDAYVALDVGPLGKLLKPLGDLDFEDAVACFAEIVKLGVDSGVDLIFIETMNDSLETKAAVLAAKENTDLPIFATNTYDEQGKLMTGAGPGAMVAMLEGLGVDALGINCGLGPEAMLPVVRELLDAASVPVIVNPNAGLPQLKNGKTEFSIGPEAFAETMVTIAGMGACILGGCCGTTPAHIKTLREKTEDMPFVYPAAKRKTVVSSYSHAVAFEARPVLIGERINPTGKKLFKAALRERNFDYILQEAISQQDKGADVLDVNVGLPEIDEVQMLTKSVSLLQTVTDLPLQIDTADTAAMEAALRLYNGKALINSVNGKQEVMDKVFPLAAHYGGVVVALTLDEAGIPETAEGRLRIADKIVREAAKYGIDKENLLFDPLAMSVSSDAKSAEVTLRCVKELTKRGLKTSLGVSNVSFGLPNRNLLNACFLTMAMQAGLSAAIINPHAAEMLDAYYSFCALSGIDLNFERYINYVTQAEADRDGAEKTEEKPQKSLGYASLKGMQEEAAQIAGTLLETMEPLSVINEHIIPALDEMGQRFENKKAFLPQLLMSAEAAKSAFSVIRERLAATDKKQTTKDKIVLATVRGDIHDIGKNIVKVLLQNYDYEVLDLGKDVAPEEIVSVVKREQAKFVALSALMTTTVPAMEETVRQLRKECPDCKVMVGGAVLTQDYADMIGADFYGKDAMSAVRFAESS